MASFTFTGKSPSRAASLPERCSTRYSSLVNVRISKYILYSSSDDFLFNEKRSRIETIVTKHVVKNLPLDNKLLENEIKGNSP